MNQQDATLAVLCLSTTTSMLYMFRTPFASIIRSNKTVTAATGVCHAVIYKVTYKQVLCVIQVVE